MAFVGVQIGSSGVTARRGSTTSVRYGVPVTLRSKRCLLRMAEEPKAEAEEEEFVLPEEPYPGYYDDLRRSGLDPVEEMKKKAAKKKRKVGGKASLYRPDGTAYAPWMIGAIQEELPSSAPRKAKTDAVGNLATDPQAQELAGVGLRYKVMGDELLLIWATGDEPDNQGFTIRKRKGKTEDWVMVADYKSHPAELTSKGAQGGSYNFLDKEPEPGTWIYRVSDTDQNGRQSDLSQTIVEVQSLGEQRTQVIALVAVIVIFAVFGILSSLSDPLSGLQ